MEADIFILQSARISDAHDHVVTIFFMVRFNLLLPCFSAFLLSTLLSSIMAKGYIYTDDDDSDTGTVSKPSKSRRTNDDNPTTGPAENRPRRTRKPTAKRADNGD